MMQEMYRQTSYPLAAPWAEPELAVQAVGLFKSSGRFRWAQVSQRHCFHVVESGEGIFNADGKAFEVGEGQIFSFFPGQYIEYHDFPDTPWEYTWIALEGCRVGHACAEIGITRQNPLVSFSDNPVFTSVLRSIVRKVIAGAGDKLWPITAAWELLAALDYPAHEAGRDAISDSQRLYEEGRILIESQLDCTLTVDMLADHFHVNRTTLFRAFKAHAGVSPKQYIDASRFKRAEELLTRSKLSLAQIAQACGFTDRHYFCHAFRKRVGLTPVAFRTKWVSL